MLQSQQAGAEAAVGQPSVYRDKVTWAIAGAVFCAYTTISVFRLLQLNPSSWDLAIFTEAVKQYAHVHAPIADVRGSGTNLLGDHFSPVLVLLAPFFRVFPSPATLLGAQALLVAVSVFPVAAAARQVLGAGPARVVALCYGFCWGLQQMINFDVHEIAFAVPLLAFSVSALVRGNARASFCWALPMVFVKEDQGFTVAAIGLYLLFSGVRQEQADRFRVRAGAFAVCWGLLWSLLAIVVIIPHFNATHTYYYWGDGGAFGPGGHPSPGAAVGQFFSDWPGKLETTIFLLLPVAFLALRSPLALLAVPMLGLRFESSNTAYWGTGWHYNATVMPIVFLAAVDGLARLRSSGELTGWRDAWQRHGVAMMLAVAVPFAFQYPLSGLWNANTYKLDAHVAAANAAMARVPDGASVLTTLDLLAPLAARTDTYWIGNAGNPRTEYIVFDGVNSDYSPPVTDVPGLIAKFYPGNVYRQIHVSGDVYVFKRV